MGSLLEIAARVLKELRQDDVPDPARRCPHCGSTGHGQPGPECEGSRFLSCPDLRPAAPVVPTPECPEHEPGADAQPEEVRRPLLEYRPGEVPAWCRACDVELVNLRVSDGLCGPCRWQRQQRRRQ